MPRTAGRILGWLLVCDPPHQTMPDLVEALQVSKSSISTASRLLLQMSLVERLSLPGERKDFYRIRNGAWKEAMALQSKSTTEMRQLADQGLALLADTPSRNQERLREMQSLFAFFEEKYPVLISEWLELQQKVGS